jgi:hypothetical protein
VIRLNQFCSSFIRYEMTDYRSSFMKATLKFSMNEDRNARLS